MEGDSSDPSLQSLCLSQTTPLSMYSPLLHVNPGLFCLYKHSSLTVFSSVSSSSMSIAVVVVSTGLESSVSSITVVSAITVVSTITEVSTIWVVVSTILSLLAVTAVLTCLVVVSISLEFSVSAFTVVVCSSGMSWVTPTLTKTTPIIKFTQNIFIPQLKRRHSPC